MKIRKTDKALAIAAVLFVPCLLAFVAIGYEVVPTKNRYAALFGFVFVYCTLSALLIWRFGRKDS